MISSNYVRKISSIYVDIVVIIDVNTLFSIKFSNVLRIIVSFVVSNDIITLVITILALQ